MSLRTMSPISIMGRGSLDQYFVPRTGQTRARGHCLYEPGFTLPGQKTPGCSMRSRRCSSCLFQEQPGRLWLRMGHASSSKDRPRIRRGSCRRILAIVWLARLSASPSSIGSQRDVSSGKLGDGPRLFSRKPQVSIVLQFGESPPDEEADAIHFTAELERLDAHSLGLAIPSFCIPNAVPVEEFRSLPERSEARRGLGIDEGIPVVAFVGRLDRRKALDILMKAFARVSGRASEAVLVLAGPDYGEMAMLKTLSRSLNIESRVIFLGLVDAQKRAEVLASADLVALTSLAENLATRGPRQFLPGYRF